MWSNCEQLLADGGAGCLFALRKGIDPPRFCKDGYCGPIKDPDRKALKSIGDGLSVNRNLKRMCATIHSGIFDEMVTYHIADAQLLIKIAYYMMRTTRDVSLVHAVNCNPCLNATFREYQGFYRALHATADRVNHGADKNLGLRLNKTRWRLPYPKVRARRGYCDWHGVREVVPGAGRLARLLDLLPAQRFAVAKFREQHTFVGMVSENDVESDRTCLAIAAFPSGEATSYIALLVSGEALFSTSARIEYSVRLNIWDLERLHASVQSFQVSGRASDYFKHPLYDAVLSSLELKAMLKMTEVSWGRREHNEFSGSAAQS